MTALAAVLALVAKATPGEWRDGGRTVRADETEDRLGMEVRLNGGNGDDNRRNARAIAAAINYLRAHGPAMLAMERDAGLVAELVAAAKRVNADHTAPHDCYSTGPCTGNPIADFVACPGCCLSAALSALGKVGCKSTLPGQSVFDRDNDLDVIQAHKAKTHE